LFDEPTTQLDLMSRNRLLRLLGDLNQPCIIASHDLSFMQTMDRVLVIMDGGVAMDGQADEVLEWYRQQCEERN
jgi:biotin transport system ATP-binding protein